MNSLAKKLEELNQKGIQIQIKVEDILKNEDLDIQAVENFIDEIFKEQKREEIRKAIRQYLDESSRLVSLACKEEPGSVFEFIYHQHSESLFKLAKDIYVKYQDVLEG